ncbi:uncharacterized protein SCDLUD_004258 [Saccharomycodes ludwigii]|uniref:uncharacterized protein n=1 Tax=Saccharomycodes ludwigii TaxID=36035 RepID=UPI001E87C2A4|nr:hypothetical protein SCDLUD_004258 [Saccharomycodes ludwigii]KAH3899942.1 hypothetical protein SCDLUD_004258 [Saccharomycodes ludwigii]
MHFRLKKMVFKRFYSQQRQPVSPHALIYRVWAKPVGKALFLSLSTYYSLYYLREFLDDSNITNSTRSN